MTKATKIVVSFSLGMIPMLLLAHEYGPDPRNTGAPGDNALGCAQSTCHTSSAKGGPLLTSTPGGSGVFATFSSGTTYTPGVPVTITVTVSDPANTHYGFQMTARLESNLSKAQAGDFTVGSTPNCPASNESASCQTILCDDGQIKTAKGCSASAPVQFIEHDYSAGTHVGVGPYTFTWTPPATNMGNVHFYIAGNAVNNNLLADGADHVYANTYVLTPGAAGQAPTVTSVNSGTDFGGMASFASGSWLEIKGTNLSTGTRIWAGADFSGSNAPTSLDGIKASVNGKAAFVYYISPTQINVQTPDDTATGPVAITVTNPSGTSAAVNAQKAAVVPGMLAPASFNVGGKQYLVALYPDGATYVGNSGLIAGVAFRPAKPGDAVTAYGIGFGSVTPAIASGVVVSQQNQIPNLTMTLGGVTVKPGYAGLAPNFVGLYQFNFTVPAVPNGDQPVTFSVGGVAAQSSMFLTVHD
jgi:uncharacterized protein (TIGR03437 family)